MPWVNKVAGILQTWYSGNEVGNALADVLVGRVNPGGKLPITFPVKEQDIPAWGSDKCEEGKIQYVVSHWICKSREVADLLHFSYREDVYVGYKYYHFRAVKPLYPFG